MPMADRDPVSQLTALAAVSCGALFVRTHAPRMMRQFIEMAAKAGLKLASPPAP